MINLEKNMNENNKFSLVKIVAMLFLYILFLSSVYYKAINLGISNKLAVISVIAFTCSTLVFLVVYFKLKTNKKVKFISFLLSGVVFVILAVNINYLRAEYFIPHTTTTIGNRYLSQASIMTGNTANTIILHVGMLLV